MNKESRRKQLYRLLGRLPDRHREIGAKKLSEERRNGYILERLVLDLNGLEPVPAYFVKPFDHPGKLPVILYNHAHGGRYEIGKDELIAGRNALQNPPYADVLTSLGFAALCLDMWAFGERRGRTESEIFKEFLWRGRVMWGMMVYDSLRAVDYLTGRPDVDPERIGTMGISMGSTMAWWLAALDERIKVCVDMCCLTEFQALLDSRGLDGHSFYYYVPDLLNHFSTADINALIAPRAHLSLQGNYDPLTPPKGLELIDAELKKIYAAEHASDQWKLIRYDTGHYETFEMRTEIIKFFKQKL